MSGLPTPTIELSTDGSTWNDITAFVSLPAGIKAKRGRTTEFDSVSPGTLSFTIDSPSVASWGIGGFYYAYGYMRQNVHVRVKDGATNVWRGRIDAYRWRPGRTSASTVVEVTATDECKTWAKAKLYPYGVETPKTELAWYTGGIYPMQPRDVGSYLGAHRDPTLDTMKVVLGSAGGRSYSQDGPPFVKQAMKIIPRGGVGPVMEHPVTWGPQSQFGLVSVWFRTENTTDTMYLFSMLRTSGGAGYCAVWLDGTTGRLTFSIAGDSGGSITHTPTGGGYDDLNDGDWHLLTFWLYEDTGTTKLRYYIDGSAAASTTSGGSTINIGSSNRRAVFGGQRNSSWTANQYAWDGDIAAPAIFTYSTISDNVRDWYDDGMDGGEGQTITQRCVDLCGFVGSATPTVTSTSGYSLAGQDLAGKSLLEAYQEIATGELGVFFASATGAPKLRGYTARTVGTYVMTLSATQDLVGDLEMELDDATYANYVRATSPTGTVAAYDTGLIASDGAPLIDEWATLVRLETSLATHAANRLAMRTNTTPRLSRVTVDLLTTPNSIETDVLTLEPLDRVRITGLDSTLFGSSTYYGFVEGWELVMSATEYKVILDLSPDL